MSINFKNIGERITNPFLALVMLGLLGSGLGSFGIYLIRPADSLGQLMAWLCIYRQSCDFNTNLVSIALALYLSAGILTIFGLMFYGFFRDYDKDLVLDDERLKKEEDLELEKALEDDDKEETAGTDMYRRILRLVKRSGDKGIRPIEISDRLGYNVMDVHTYLGIMWDGGDVDITQTDGHTSRYILRETEEEKEARHKPKEEREIARVEVRKGNWRQLPKALNIHRSNLIAIGVALFGLFFFAGLAIWGATVHLPK